MPPKMFSLLKVMFEERLNQIKQMSKCFQMKLDIDVLYMKMCINPTCKNALGLNYLKEFMLNLE